MQKVKEMFSSNNDHSSSSTSPRSSLGHDTRINADTPGSNSAGTNTAPYDVGTHEDKSNLPKSTGWTLGALGGKDHGDHDRSGSGTHYTTAQDGLTGNGTPHHGTTSGVATGLGSRTGDTSYGDNVHSGSTHGGSNTGSAVSGGGLGNAASGAGSNRNASGYDNDNRSSVTSGHTGDRSSDNRHSGGLSGAAAGITSKLGHDHTIGHDSRDTSKFDPAGSNTTHDHKHLQAVTHRQQRESEVEEVERIRNVDRHVHHLQHHVQPVHDTVVKDEVHHNQVHPVTNIQEKHVNTDEDVKLFSGLGAKHRDTETHLPKERTVVDLGEKVNTATHHHVHHVTQPVVEQEIHNRHRIHTQIPLSHTVHEAPIIHKSSVHEPVHMSDFLKGGGKLDSGITHDRSGVLSTGDCDRQVDGLGEKLVQDLNLKPSTFGQSGTSSTVSPTSATSTGSHSGMTGSHGTSGLTGDRTTGSHGTSGLTGDRTTGSHGLTGNNSSSVTGNNTTGNPLSGRSN